MEKGEGHKHDVLNIVTLAITPVESTVCQSVGSGEMEVPKGNSFSTAFRPFIFASASADGTVRLWCGREWVCIRVFSPTASPDNEAAMGQSPKSASLMHGLMAGHNPSLCMTCAPGEGTLGFCISINTATQMLSRHLQKNKGNKPVERSVNALKGLVLTPSTLAVGNMTGNIYVYSMDKIYQKAVENCFGRHHSQHGDGEFIRTVFGDHLLPWYIHMY
eukprot:scaffold142385_cov50-Prasinocladus_malaysianus.AAC.2